MRLELKQKLDAYAEQARQAKRRSRVGKIPALATATGAALAMTTSAEADIIYSGIQDRTLTASSMNSAPKLSLNIRTPAAKGSTLQLEAFVFGHAGFLLEATAKAGSHVLINSTALLKKFSFGANISGNPSVPGSGAIIHGKGGMGGSVGEFVQSVTGYAGFVLAGDESGWIRLKWTASSNSTVVTLTAIDWAYNNTPGGIITAGEGISSVPEPSSLSLALLAAGSGGVLALRKRGRSAAQSKKQEAKVSTL